MGIGDWASDAWNSVSKGVEKVAKSAGREAQRIHDETIENMDKDFDDVSKAIDNGGFVGGALEVMDVLSFGHQAANTLDAWNVIPENEALKEGISGGLNWSLGNPIALKDAWQAFQHLGGLDGLVGGIGGAIGGGGNTQPAPGGGGGTTVGGGSSGQFPMLPPGLELRPGVPGWPPGDIIIGRPGGPGGVGDDCCPPGCGNDRIIVIDDPIARPFPPIRRPRPDDNELERMIKKILANPNLAFEDMIYMVLRLVLKDSQKQARAKLEGLTESRITNGESRSKLEDALSKAQDKFANAAPGSQEANKAKVELDRAQLALNKHDTSVSESRQEMFEDLKNIMQKVSEMEQALSNILNSMHETSMSAIRNIR